MWNGEITTLEPYNNYVEAYRVPSDSVWRAAYVVAKTGRGEWNCSCPDWVFRRPEGGCKHVTYVNAWKIRNNIPVMPVAASMPLQTTRFAALDV